MAISDSNETNVQSVDWNFAGSEGSTSDIFFAWLMKSMSPAITASDLIIRPWDRFNVKSVMAAIVSGLESESPSERVRAAMAAEKPSTV